MHDRSLFDRQQPFYLGHRLHGVPGIQVGADTVGVLLGHHRPADHGKGLDPGRAEFFDDIIHLRHGGGHQGRQTDGMDGEFFCLGNNGGGRHILADIKDLEAVIFQQGADDVLADIVDITLNGGHQDPPETFKTLPLHLLFQAGETGLHGIGRLHHLGQESRCSSRNAARPPPDPAESLHC